MEKQNKKTLLQFLPFSTLIDSSFWFEIKRIKLEELKLDIKPIDICPSFTIRGNTSNLVTLNYESFRSYQLLNEQRKDDNDDLFYLNGKLIIYNTLQEFENANKQNLVADEGKFIWDSINNESERENIDDNLEFYLARFLMIIFGDFKTYNFHYWNAYPALAFPPNCFQILNNDSNSFRWDKYFILEQAKEIFDKLFNIPIKQRMFFIILLSPLTDTTINPNNDAEIHFENYRPTIMLFKEFWNIETLEHWAAIENLKIIFAFADCSSFHNYPGWLLRNYLSYLHARISQLLRRHRDNELILSLVTKMLFRNYLQISSVSLLKHLPVENLLRKSFMHQISLLPSNYKKISTESYLSGFIEDVNKLYGSNNKTNDPNKRYFVPTAVGWERNKKMNNRLIPNQVNCSNMLNPEIIASDALNLNLKLMKWRLVEKLNLEKIKNTRCLLLGSGTLGCNVARALVAWGVNHITMVDNKNVSFSNPARQSLYTYQDAIDGKHSKAETAAMALKQINPLIESKGVELNIKMPDHSFEKSIEEELKEIEKLEQLIDDNDVVFLMTDTRESRWLPTLISTSKHKIIINVALGYDSFLVQRFGVRIREENSIDQQSPLYTIYQKQRKLYQLCFPDKESSNNSAKNILIPPIYLGADIGCYFCNDVFAPSNSTKDRTLDQQCTVTRPGLSMIASGYAVEMLIAILQHPAGPLAPASTMLRDDSNKLPELLSKLQLNDDSDLNKFDTALLSVESLMGIIPFEFRGFLSFYEQMMPCTPRLECCIACSSTVIDQYRTNRDEFLYQAINDSKSLEKLTGIDRFHSVQDDIDRSFGSDDNEIVELE